MRSRDPRVPFEDILENIARIERHTAGMDKASFAQDEKTIDAVERCLARISEAAVKLGETAQELCPEWHGGMSEGLAIICDMSIDGLICHASGRWWRNTYRLSSRPAPTHSIA